MFELVPHLFYVFLAILLSRSCAIVVARRQVEKTPGEEVMASLHVLFTRDVAMMQDTFYACVLVLKENGVRRPTWALSCLHMSQWGVFVLLLLAIGFGPFIKMAWASIGQGP